MKIGALTSRVTLESLTEQRTVTGAVTKVWAPVASVRASVRPQSARELAAASGRYQETSHTITVRYFPNVTNEMRVVFGARVFEIQAVIDLMERNQWLSLVCREVS